MCILKYGNNSFYLVTLKAGNKAYPAAALNIESQALFHSINTLPNLYIQIATHIVKGVFDDNVLGLT